MKKSDIGPFLRALGTEVEVDAGEWLRARCPMAFALHDSGQDSNPSFAVKIEETGESFFHCFTCESGSLMKLVQVLAELDAPYNRLDIKTAMEYLVAEMEGKVMVDICDYDPYVKPVIDTIWSEDWLASFQYASQVPRAMQYLKAGRKNPLGVLCPVDDAVIAACDIRYDTSKNTVAFPIRNEAGALVGMRGRRLDGGYYMYDYYGDRNSLPWLGEHKVDYMRPVLLVESVFDYASALRVYDNVLAPLTVGMGQDKVLRIGSALEIVTLFDNGVGGEKAREKIKRFLPDSVQKHLYPLAGYSDPADMSEFQLRELLGGYLPLHLAA